MRCTNLAKLKRRSDFLTLQKEGRYVRLRSAGVQFCCVESPEACRKGAGGDAFVLFVGFTASRKVGNAVQRNRAKRRLRAWVAWNLFSLLQSLDFSKAKTRAVSLSRVTWKAFWDKRPSCVNLLGTEACVLAFVFIANKTTPEVSWKDLDQELREAVRRVLEVSSWPKRVRKTTCSL